MEVGGGHDVPPLPEELLVIDSCQEKEKLAFFFFKGIVPGRSNMLQWMTTHPRIYRMCFMGLDGLKQ